MTPSTSSALPMQTLIVPLPSVSPDKEEAVPPALRGITSDAGQNGGHRSLQPDPIRRLLMSGPDKVEQAKVWGDGYRAGKYAALRNERVRQ